MGTVPLAAAPGDRREDVRAILNQQITAQAVWSLAYYALQGRTAEWVEKYVMTPQLKALVPQGADTATVTARWHAAGQTLEYGELAWYLGKQWRYTRPVVLAVARFATKIISKYVVSFTLGSALTATGVASWLGVALDAGVFIWTVHDLWTAKDQLIDSILSTWYD